MGEPGQSDPETSVLPDLDYLTDEPPTIHAFPSDRRYRRSCMAKPQAGDIARCGVVKRTPPTSDAGKPVTCAACARLLRLEGFDG